MTCRLLFVVGLAACAGAAPEDSGLDPVGCDNGMPSGTVDVRVTGAEEIEVAFEVPCGTPEAGYGTLGQHTAPAEGDDKVLVIGFTQGEDDWLLSVGAALDTVVTGSVPVMLEGSPGFGRFGHGAFVTPVTSDGEFYFATSGTVTIDAVSELDLVYLQYVVVSGSFDATYAHEGAGTELVVAAEFTNFLAASLSE